MAPQDVVLESPRVRRASSSVDAAIAESNAEIIRRAQLLRSNGEGLEGIDLLRYCSLAGDIGYRRMERIGSEILTNGGTFTSAEIVDLIRDGDNYALKVVEAGTQAEFTLPCRRMLRQYEGGPIDLGMPNALNGYRGRPVTLDVARRGAGYEVSMIGLADKVLEDAPQATPINLMH